MTKKYTSKEIKDRLSNIGEAIGNIALEYITELEKENERLKGDLELWESGGCRATNLFECGVVKELKEQIEKMKCCWNCKYGENSENKLPCSSCNKNWIVRKRLKKLSDKWEIKE